MNDGDRFYIPPTSTVTSYVAPAPAPAPFVDLQPLILHFEREVSRLRDQLAVERSATSSAREALAAAEERARVEREGRLEALGKANRRAVERDHARAELARASTVPPGLVPGSTAAVIEAYRLLCGHDPDWNEYEKWTDLADCTDPTINKTLGFLIRWLDNNAPGGRP